MILYGKGIVSVRDVVDGRAARVPAPVQKFRCSRCRTIGSDRLPLATPAMIEACVAGVLIEGVSGTARRLDCDRSVVHGVFKDWLAAKQSDLPVELPDAIGLHRVDLGGVERIVVSDAIEETIIEVLEDDMSLSVWLEGTPGVPTLAITAMDPALVSALERAFPGIEVAIPPLIAVRSILSAAETSLRALVRAGVAKGRNFREDGALLHVGDDEMSDDARGELACWDARARAIRRLARDVVEALESRRKDALRSALDDAIAALGSAVPVGALGKLFVTWRDRILAGLDNAWTDRIVVGIDAILRSVAEAPWTLKKGIRTYLLFFHADRSIENLQGSSPPRGLWETVRAP